MSNPFADPNEQILEGFLCPICKEDLKTPDRLTSHVESQHSEDQDIIKSFKDIFITAKKKYFDESVVNGQAADKTPKSLLQQTHNRLAYVPPPVPQEIGTDVDHISYFKAIRLATDIS